MKTFAAIDIGSFELSMKIFQLTGKNVIRVIDTLHQSLDLGSETYATGRISSQKLDELCKALIKLKTIMKGYKVDSYKVYGTSALREAENMLILLDQISQRTGLQVKVLSNSEQRFLDYKSLASQGEAFRKIIVEKTAIVDIGGGSIQLSLFDNDTLVSTQNIRLGVLRTYEMISHMQAQGHHKDQLIEELLAAQLSTYKKLYLKDREIHNLIVVDDYISPIAAKRGSMLVADDFQDIIQMIMTQNITATAKKLDMQEEKVPLLLISSILMKKLLEITGAVRVWAPGVSLSDGMAYEYAEETKMLSGEHDFEQDIIACAMNISKRYMGSRKRGETLERITTVIFDSMKKVHGLGNRERLYLRIAAMLHDCGKYISLVNIGETSYNIIMATEIIGLSHIEREIVANIVRFNHSDFTYYSNPYGTGMDKQTYLIVAKLTAILRLANSLDRSHKQKLKGIKASLQEECLILSVDTQEDTALEKGFFQMTADFFKEVFSITPVLKTKKRI